MRDAAVGLCSLMLTMCAGLTQIGGFPSMRRVSRMKDGLSLAATKITSIGKAASRYTKGRNAATCYGIYSAFCCNVLDHSPPQFGAHTRSPTRHSCKLAGRGPATASRVGHA